MPTSFKEAVENSSNGDKSLILVVGQTADFNAWALRAAAKILQANRSKFVRDRFTRITSGNMTIRFLRDDPQNFRGLRDVAHVFIEPVREIDSLEKLVNLNELVSLLFATFPNRESASISFLPKLDVVNILREEEPSDRTSSPLGSSW